MSRGTAHPDRRSALVTGASSGIGEATALRLAAAGHPVALSSRRVERLEATAKKIRHEGGEAVAVELDLEDPESPSRCVESATEALGELEVLVSVAGDVLPTKAHQTDPGEFARQIRINLDAVQDLVHSAVPAMVQRGRGDIVFVTSDVVRVPRPTMSSYVASKWGLEGLPRAMQLELESTGVHASIVRPGPTVTEMGTGFPPETIPDLMREWGRYGLMRHDGYLEADGVARAVEFVVAAPRGTHITIVEVEPEAPVAQHEQDQPNQEDPGDRP